MRKSVAEDSEHPELEKIELAQHDKAKRSYLKSREKEGETGCCLHYGFPAEDKDKPYSIAQDFIDKIHMERSRENLDKISFC